MLNIKRIGKKIRKRMRTIRRVILLKPKSIQLSVHTNSMEIKKVK
jgi:hypothetical protein